MSNNVEQIKERLSIEEVVGQYVALKSAGSNLKGLCPFHSEKTPSFVVSPARETYHCFGCGVGGDIFTFIQEIEGLDFRGSLKMLADKAGVELVFDSNVQKNDTDSLFSILEAVTNFYEDTLKHNDGANEYLKSRGLTKETIRSFRIGFASENWSDALEYLKKNGFTIKDIEAAGIIKQGNRGEYDRFRSRIMFPIFDSVGRVVAFSGRIFQLSTPSTKLEHEQAKYINSPETALYHKSKILFGYDRARQAIRKTQFTILVEGQMDLLMTHQVGYTNTVALSGTALTKEHLKLIGRMSCNLVIALDADSAGITSAGKSAHAALQDGFDVKIAELPEGDDPADMISRGDIKEWKDVIKNSKHIIDFLLDYYRTKTKDERTFKLTVEKEILPYILDISSEIDKSHFIQRVAAQLSVKEEAVRQELSKIKQTPQNEGIKKEMPENTSMTNKISSAEEELVLMYLWQKSLKEPFIDIAGVCKQIEEVITPVGLRALETKVANNTEAAFSFELLYKDMDTMKNAINELLERITQLTLHADIERVSIALRKAEGSGNKADIIKFMNKEKELSEKVAKLPHNIS